jgi:hypothetical protein
MITKLKSPVEGGCFGLELAEAKGEWLLLRNVA